MGRDNRQRRKAKSREKLKRRVRDRNSSQTPSTWEELLVQARYVLVQIMADACPCGECDAPTWEQSAHMLSRATGHDRWPEAVATVIDAVAEDAVGQTWDRGWMPRDVLSLMSKDASTPVVKAAATLMRSELRRYAEAQLSDLWSAQREALAEHSAPESAKEVLADRAGPAWIAAAAPILEALYTLADLEPIPMVQPRPGGRSVSVRGDGAESAKVYEKIRALLAKAESTDSDAEAEAFTAKAQQLIARHSINEALLADTQNAAVEAAAVRVYVEKPYEKQKSELLHVVADANGCRAVYSLAAGFCTVVGARTNLRSVELLYNSLLVQATSAMTRAGARRDSAGRSRTRSFRQSFLASFAMRIGERLTDSAEATVREVADETGTDLVPVMRLQREAVDAKTEELFPNLTFRAATRISDYEGHIAGRAAADRARLQGAEEIRNRLGRLTPVKRRATTPGRPRPRPEGASARRHDVPPVPHHRRMEPPPRTQLRVAPAGDLPIGLTAHGDEEPTHPCVITFGRLRLRRRSRAMSVPSDTLCRMTSTDEAWRIGKSRQYRRLSLSGLGLREIVHYANGKHPEGELVLEDGRKIELAIGDLEFAAEEPLRVTAEYHGDSTYLVRYTGPAVENADIAVAFDGGTWQEEFVQDLDRWIESGYTEDLGYVVDARIMPRTA